MSLYASMRLGTFSSGLVIVTYFYEIEFSFLFLSPQLNIDNIDGVKKETEKLMFSVISFQFILFDSVTFFSSCDEGGGIFCYDGNQLFVDFH